MIYRTLSKVDPDNKGRPDKPLDEIERRRVGKKYRSTPDRRKFVTWARFDSGDLQRSTWQIIQNPVHSACAAATDTKIQIAQFSWRKSTIFYVLLTLYDT